jgi:hypothetical protein
VVSTGCCGFRPCRAISLRLQLFNRLGLCNPLGENQPSLSGRSELFAVSPVAYGLFHFCVRRFSGIRLRSTAAHGSTTPLQARYFPSHALPMAGSSGEVTIA